MSKKIVVSREDRQLLQDVQDALGFDLPGLVSLTARYMRRDLEINREKAPADQLERFENRIEALEQAVADAQGITRVR